METAFNKFITNVPREKEQFDAEYTIFLLSECILEKMEEKIQAANV